MIRSVLLDKETWVDHIMLDPDTGLDPPGYKIRAVHGKMSICLCRCQTLNLTFFFFFFFTTRRGGSRLFYYGLLGMGKNH